MTTMNPYYTHESSVEPVIDVAHPPKWFADANQDTKDLYRLHSLGVKIGVGVAAFFSFFFVVAALSCIVSAFAGTYYIRAGATGVSLRMPDGLFRAFERDFEWDEIAQLTVVQVKHLGSISRNAGNIGGELRLRTHDGLDRSLRLDHFREDAWLISNRIQEAQQMHPALLA